MIYPKPIVQLREFLREILDRLIFKGWLWLRPYERWEAMPICPDCKTPLDLAQSGTDGRYHFDCAKCRVGKDDYSHYYVIDVYAPLPDHFK